MGSGDGLVQSNQNGAAVVAGGGSQTELVREFAGGGISASDDSLCLAVGCEIIDYQRTLISSKLTENSQEKYNQGSHSAESIK
jgi:hypothetical protein